MRKLAVLTMFTVAMMAQTANPDPAVVADQAEKARLDAKKALIDAQIALRQSERALAALDKANPNSDATAVATAETARVNAETALLNARKAAGAAMIPDLSKAPGNAGDFTVSGSPVEGVAMAYKALDKIGGQFARDIDCKDKTVLIYAKSDLDSLDTFRAWETQMNTAKLKLEAAQKADTDVETFAGVNEGGPSNPALLLGAIGPALEGLNKLIGMFRVDTTITVSDVTTDEKALVALLAPKFGDKCKVYYPVGMPVGTGVASTSVETTLDRLRGLRDDIATRNFARTQDKKLSEAKLKAATNDNGKALWGTHIANVEGLLEVFKAALALVDGVEQSLLKVEAGSGLSQLVSLRRAALFAAMLKTESGLGVQITVQKLASNTRTRKNAFWGTRLDFAGGAVASFIAFEFSNGSFAGKVYKSGRAEVYSGYRKQGQLQGN